MIKIFSWNVNGIRAVSKKGFLDFVNTYKPDILCLQETKASPEQLPSELIERDDYTIYYSSAEKKGYSGVSIWSKRPALQIEEFFDEPRFNGEGRLLKANFGSFLLYNIYFPNGTSSEDRLKYKMDFYDYFLGELKNVDDRPVLVCGDVNTAHTAMDLKNAKANEKNSGFLPEERAWIDKLIESGYTDTFRFLHPELIKYSWWSYRMGARKRNIGWRIDYHFVNQHLVNFLRESEIHNEVLGSDHCPVSVTLELNTWG